MNAETREAWMARCGETTLTDRRNLRLLLWACAGWAAVFLGVSYSMRGGFLPAGPAAWIIAALPAAAAVGVVLVYLRFLREADELYRLIHFRALALGFGALWLALSSYPLFEELGAPAADAGDYMMILSIAWSAAIVIGTRRYR